MVGLRLNRAEYFNDAAEEFRLFLGMAEIRLADGEGAEDFDTAVELTLARGVGCAYAAARAGTIAAEDEMELPADAGSLLVKKIEKRVLKLACYHLLKQLYPDVATPWGSLTGIRPTKLFRELTQEGGLPYARAMFLDVFGVSPEKTALAENICAVQKPVLDSAEETDADVYVGIPFCPAKCLYCSFPSEVLKNPAHLSPYLDALRRDIASGARLARESGVRIRAFYMGGGTPTVLRAGQMEELLTYLYEQYGSLGEERTVEAGRPDTIDREKLETLRRMGITRISINPQTMNDETLRRVGRAHTAADAERAYYLAREVGFESINMDLIAGLPGETAADMRASCERVVRLAPDCLTVHSLAVKRSSRLKTELLAVGETLGTTPAAEVEEMTRIGADCARSMGMRPYYLYRQKYMSGNLENVGYALPGKDCVYNVDMMEETASILSHGAGTMTKRVIPSENRIERLAYPKDIATYYAKLDRLCEEKRELFSDAPIEKGTPAETEADE